MKLKRSQSIEIISGNDTMPFLEEKRQKMMEAKKDKAKEILKSTGLVNDSEIDKILVEIGSKRCGKVLGKICCNIMEHPKLTNKQRKALLINMKFNNYCADKAKLDKKLQVCSLLENCGCKGIMDKCMFSNRPSIISTDVMYARAVYCTVLGLNVAEGEYSIIKRSEKDFKKIYDLSDDELKERYLQKGYIPLKFAITPIERKQLYMDFFLQNGLTSKQGEAIYAVLGDIIANGKHTNLIKMQEAMDSLTSNFSDNDIVELLMGKSGHVKNGYTLLANFTRQTPNKIQIAKTIEREYNKRGFAKQLLLAVARAHINLEAYYRYRYLKDNVRGKISVYAIVHAANFKRTVSRHLDVATAIKVSTHCYLESLYGG